MPAPSSQVLLAYMHREQRLASLLAQQEPLLYSCTYLLLNMAEDQTVEQKMLKKVRQYGHWLYQGGLAWLQEPPEFQAAIIRWTWEVF